ncbi:MAG: ZPR1 zinc finger domain-containing protein [Euryarchaeota archaeon]|nr:ZPR1 zinc finger domain-containing protein [Euryarchaeota archaeon]
MFRGFPCPVCGGNKTENTFETLDIPYFGEVLESTARCTDCKWRHVDVLVLKKDRPRRHTLRIESPDDMDIRVVRSSQGTIRVPEIGVEITPGTAGEGFITNVEGIFERIEDVLDSPSLQEDGKRREKARELKEKIRDIKEGRMEATLIIEDPTGNSSIISEKAAKEDMHPE